MKKSIFKIHYFSMLLIFIFATACSSDDDSGTNTPNASLPTVSYANSSIDATFFEAGNSAAPNITWNGNVGTFSLAAPLQGLSINANTGALSWTKLLPQGQHAIEVLVANSAGQKSVNLTLENIFFGNFSYRLENKCSYEVYFSKDGSLTVKYMKGQSVLANGTWEIQGNELTANYTFINDNEMNSMRAQVMHTLAEVKLEGDWFNGLDTVSGQEGGYVNLKLGELPAGDGIISLMDNGNYVVLFYDGCNAGCCYSTVQEALTSYSNRTLTFVP